MSRRQVWAVIALVAVFVWSAVMAVVGQTAAVAALVPSLILTVEHVGAALSGGEACRTQSPPPAAAPAEGGDEERAG
ncbi:hypothetical protein AB0G67_36865 [Streptomyces sp. NPDC021056]|uniref:hypothetical protein n=1 Tax=Streptomyces sp. NPDC021056 TaxID=3155012 RepID=UPI0033E90F35